MLAPIFSVDICLVPESALGNALQFIDLLRSANLLARLRLGHHAPRLAWRLRDAGGRPLPALPGPWEVYGDTAVDGPAQATFIPSFHAADIPAIRQVVARHPGLVRQIGVAVDAGQTVLTVGSGAWLVAASGRLQGRTASLPWFYMAGFARDFPGIGLAPDQDWTVDGPWMSCALPHGLSQLAIALVHRALGKELGDACHTVLVPDHARARAAVQANAQQHIPATRDSTLARAIAWMEEHLDQPYSLEHLAQVAAVSTRTLLRHFRAELAQSPLDYLHALRCARAKVMLEVTLESVPSIAVACGYADPAAFRRIFVRHMGMPPAEYRKRHALRAPRRRWRVDVAGA